MKIKSVRYADPREAGWSVDTLHLKDSINLFVGASGSGKTRVLNILFNLAGFVTRDGFADGQWTLHFEHSGVEYTWTCDSVRGHEDRESRVLSEKLWIGTPSHVERTLFARSENEFQFGSQEVPKLSRKTSAINLLREEETV